MFTFYRLICVFTLLHLTNGSDWEEPMDGVVLMVAVIFNPRAGKQTAKWNICLQFYWLSLSVKIYIFFSCNPVRPLASYFPLSGFQTCAEVSNPDDFAVTGNFILIFVEFFIFLYYICSVCLLFVSLLTFFVCLFSRGWAYERRRR